MRLPQKQHICSRGPQTAYRIQHLVRPSDVVMCVVVICQRSASSVSEQRRNELELLLLNEGHTFPQIETKKSCDKFQFQTLVDN